MLVCFGELMLRLGPPGRQRLAHALPGPLDATFAGAEANCHRHLRPHWLRFRPRRCHPRPRPPMNPAFPELDEALRATHLVCIIRRQAT